jgi:small redox-active disulfide protein 2
MRIQVLGSGCARCEELVRRTEEAALHLGLGVPVEKVTDLREIMSFGVMMTPALAVNGVVRAYGRVPAREEIETILAGADRTRG